MAISFIHELKGLYTEMDKTVEGLIVKANATCRKGCNACCKMLAFAVGVEGANISIRLLRDVRVKEDFEAMVKDLRTSALAADFEGLNNTTYFAKQLPCVFLEKEGTCNIYPERPAACRYHIVLSPKENCFFGAVDPITSTLDLKMLEEVVWDLDAEMTGSISIGAPIPIMVLWTMEGLLKKMVLTAKEPEVKAEAEVKLALLLEAKKGVLTPIEWLKKHAANVADSMQKGIVSRGVIEIPEAK